MNYFFEDRPCVGVPGDELIDAKLMTEAIDTVVNSKWVPLSNFSDWKYVTGQDAMPGSKKLIRFYKRENGKLILGVMAECRTDREGNIFVSPVHLCEGYVTSSDRKEFV